MALLVGAFACAPPPATLPDPLHAEPRARLVPSAAHSLVVDWPAADRAALQAAATRALVFVRYAPDGGKIEPLFHCQAAGRYGYFPTERKAELESFRNERELALSLPLAAVGLSAKLRTTGSISVAMNVVGTFEATTPGAARDELTGECGDTTHVALPPCISSEAAAASPTSSFRLPAGRWFGSKEARS